jgi:hypothetical protein
MNVNAIASRFVSEITAGNSARKPASQAAAPQTSAVVSLSGGTTAAPLTYSAAGTAASGLGHGLPPLLLPTRANVAMLAAQAGDTINAKLDAAGISREPGFKLEIEDVNSAHVTVKSDRPDAKAIEDLINADPKLQMDIHNAYALASHIPAIDRSMAFQKDYSAARTQAEIDAVVARYSDLFSGRLPPTEIAMAFGKDGLQVSINGETAQA